MKVTFHSFTETVGERSGIHLHWDHQNFLLNYPPTIPYPSGHFPTCPFRASCWPSKPSDHLTTFLLDLTTFLRLLDDPPTSSYPRKEVKNQEFGSFQRWRRLFEKLLGRNFGTIKIIYRSSTGVELIFAKWNRCDEQPGQQGIGGIWRCLCRLAELS